MPAKLNTEFNYRYQVIGETVWEKIKTLKGFLEGRVRASALEHVSEKKYQAKIAKLQYLKDTNAPLHEILDLEAEIILPLIPRCFPAISVALSFIDI